MSPSLFLNLFLAAWFALATDGASDATGELSPSQKRAQALQAGPAELALAQAKKAEKKFNKKLVVDHLLAAGPGGTERDPGPGTQGASGRPAAPVPETPVALPEAVLVLRALLAAGPAGPAYEPVFKALYEALVRLALPPSPPSPIALPAPPRARTNDCVLLTM